MRKFTAVVLLILCFAACAVSAAGALREIELTDGSVLRGEVLSLSKGVYTIKSADLGVIKITESKIRTIRTKSSRHHTGKALRKPTATTETSTRQERTTGEQEVKGLIRSLQNNPDFKKILEDPAIMKAVNDGDIDALTANPKFMNLLKNIVMQEIVKEMN